MDFIALDFETANKTRGSACAIGLVTVEKGEITDSFYSLIKPKNNWFDPFHTTIHGITKEDVMDSPEFDEVWEQVAPSFQKNIIIAHNASFDMSVLRHAFADYNIDSPTLDYSCSLIAARSVWPELGSHRLNILANQLQIPFQHHDALEDAKVAAHVMLNCFQHTNTMDFDQLHSQLNMTLGRIHSNGYTPARGKKVKVK
ncbi:3'-5' exonuclease [Fictibacillus iocasae]|uniref:3'-5' exonuclease n=1 Tax=Fictibacillus iocasae TaxID=2715437 RepID=A0ABW2NTR3_9BACL